MTHYFRRQLTNLLFSCVSSFHGTKVTIGRKWVLLNKGQDIGKYCLSGNSFVERPVIGYIGFSFEIMGKQAGGFYAVARGRNVGIYHTWDECKAQVNGFTSARYKKFTTSDEAQAFINEHQVKSGTSVTGTGIKTSGPSSKLLSSTAKKSSGSATKIGFAIQSSRSNLSKPVPIIPAMAMARTGQKRDLSSLKVTEDRVINKRAKRDPETPNKKADKGNFTIDEEGYVVVFTDGACTKNGRKAAKAGIGVWFGHSHPLNISEPVNGRQTNNTAEIQAAERAIKQAKENGVNKLKLKTDSQFTINCVTKWINNWRRNNWRLSTGGDVKNKEDLIKLDEAMQNMEIKWSYVAGHAGIEGNEAADRLAVAGAERSV